MMVGTLIFGPLSDSIGRKPTIYFGLGFYIIGSLICWLSFNFEMLIAGRLLQGFGAASPRIVGIAMVRDGAKGAEMSRIMSFVMSVFMLVPILAPSVGQLVLYVASWRIIFAGFVIAALLCGIWLAMRQGETLPLDKRLPFSARKLAASAAEVIGNRVALGNTIAVGAIFGAFTGYLGTSQQIFAEQYNQGAYFALWFGGLAVAVALAMITNGKMVVKRGMRPITKFAVRGFVVSWAIMMVFVFVYDGQPPLLVVGLVFFISFFFSGLLFGNYNAMAMEPMGHIAGMAAAVSGALSSLVAVVLGGVTGRLYDGTMYPISISFFVFGIFAWLASEWAAKKPTAQVQKTHP